MNRWISLFVSAASLASFCVVGCAPQDAPKTDTASTSGTTGDTAKNDTSTSTTGASSAQTTGTTPSNTTAPAETPKDGDDVAVLDTSAGKIVLMFYPEKAPKHVENFKNLAKKGFYDGTRFHRCIPGFMIQGGDPKSKDLAKAAEWGTGGNTDASGKEINVKAEFNDTHHARGILSMARSQSPDSASSQFFIMVADNPGLDGQYTAFGKVVSGMEVADKIVESGDPNNNGAVDPKNAFVLKSVKMAKWPVK